MTVDKYLTKLSNIHKENMDLYATESTSKTMAENFNSAIALYESFIPDFFSKNGSADEIRAIYKELREDYFNESTISCVDTVDAVNVYKDYSAGMQKFVTEIISAYNTGNTKVVEESKVNLETARKNDSIFIESVFTGDRIKETLKKERTLKEAVHNIETLIDFVPHIGELKSTCTSITESVDESNGMNEVVTSSIRMLYESVDIYCYDMLKTVVETYNDILDAINPKSTLPNESEISYFKLF